MTTPAAAVPDPQGYLPRAADPAMGRSAPDACLDADPEVHRVLTEKVFPRQAEVSTVAEWAQKPAPP
jgi:hypothetical protein